MRREPPMRCRLVVVLLAGGLAANPFVRAQDPGRSSGQRPVARLGLPIFESVQNPSPSFSPPQLDGLLSEQAGVRASGSHAADGIISSPARTSFPPTPATATSSVTPMKSSADVVLRGAPSKVRDPDSSAFRNTSFFGERLREKFEEWMRPGCRQEIDVRRWFYSDHEFDYFASPVSMPFLLEDPRSLTELRPVFIMQGIPNGAPNFQGGHIEFYGTQIRVAFTERFSFVMTKLGFVDINPGSGATQPGGFGFAEVHLGPKFTFLRHQETALLAAAGLNFQIPAGPARVYQDTGRVSLVPYVTFGKNFLQSRFGSLNLINTTGYSFSGDGERSDFLYNSFHLDWDIANRHKIYPMVELHYVQYTFSGGLRNLNVEGRDLANIGDVNSGGRANLNIATGLRYKLTEAAQIGFAAEFPLNVRRDLQQFRFTIDLILRY